MILYRSKDIWSWSLRRSTGTYACDSGGTNLLKWRYNVDYASKFNRVEYLMLDDLFTGTLSMGEYDRLYRGDKRYVMLGLINWYKQHPDDTWEFMPFFYWKTDKGDYDECRG